MIQDFPRQRSERPDPLRLYALVDALLAVAAIGLIAFGLDAVFHAMH